MENCKLGKLLAYFQKKYREKNWELILDNFVQKNKLKVFSSLHCNLDPHKTLTAESSVVVSPVVFTCTQMGRTLRKWHCFKKIKYFLNLGLTSKSLYYLVYDDLNVHFFIISIFRSITGLNGSSKKHWFLA